MKPLKILHLSFCYTQGGIHNMMSDIIRHQILDGHDVSLLIVSDVIDSRVICNLPEEVKLYKAHRPKGSKNPYYAYIMYKIIQRQIKPDVIHCHDSISGPILMFDRRPRIHTVHDTVYSTRCYGFFDYIVAISDSVKEHVLDTFKTDKIKTIYNGIDFSLIDTRNRYVDDDTFKMVIVSRLVHVKKGHDLLLKAMNRLKPKTNKKLMLDIVGDGASREYLFNMVEDLGLSENVCFLGAKERSWVYKHLKDYDLLVQPSRYEGFGLTIVEGFAAKIAVLASDIDGPKEILDDGKYGYTFQSENLDSLCDTLKDIINKPAQLMWKKIENDYTYMKRNFSIETTAKNYVELYRQLLN